MKTNIIGNIVWMRMKAISIHNCSVVVGVNLEVAKSYELLKRDWVWMDVYRLPGLFCHSFECNRSKIVRVFSWVEWCVAISVVLRKNLMIYWNSSKCDVLRHVRVNVWMFTKCLMMPVVALYVCDMKNHGKCGEWEREIFT